VLTGGVLTMTKGRPQKQPKKISTSKDRPRPRASDAFESVARRLECDEDKERFEGKLAKIAKVKPKGEAAN
jgi:hypothetical protein